MSDAIKDSHCNSIEIPPDVTEKQWQAAEEAANKLRNSGLHPAYINSEIDFIDGELRRQSRDHQEALQRRGSCFMQEDLMNDIWGSHKKK